MMRVMHIMAANGNGGAELYSTDLMLSLHEAGVDQCVVMRRTAPRFEALRKAGLVLETTIFDTPVFPIQKFRLGRLIDSRRPAIIHCWMRRAASLTPVRAQYADGRERPVIGWFGDRYKLGKFSSCNHFVGVTPAITDYLIGNGVSSSRSHYIPTFPSADMAAQASPDAKKAERQRHNAPDDACVLLTLSRLHPSKGIDTLIRAMAALPGMHLWIAGSGPAEAFLRSLAQQLNLQNRVRFLGWRTDRGALLRAADLCVLPSRYEPFGTVMLEAWLAGTPLVACASAGPAATIRHGANGLLAPIDDCDALAAAIRAVCRDQDLRNSMIEQGYLSYHASFTRPLVTDRWIRYYTNILHAADAPAEANREWAL